MEEKPKVTRSSPIHLLVVECSSNLNWYEIFQEATFQGQEVMVEQAEWDDIRYNLIHNNSIRSVSLCTETAIA